MPNEFFYRKALPLIIVAAIALIAAQIYSLSFKDKSDQPNVIAENSARLILDSGAGRHREFTGPVIEGMNVWQAMLQSARAGNIDINYQVKNSQFVLKSVDGLGHGQGSWVVYRNERLVDPVQLLSEPLASGDLIKVIYVGN